MQISMKAARANANLTQAAVASCLEVSETTVKNWEADAAVPKADKFLAFCELVKMSPEFIRVPGSCPKDNCGGA